MYNIKYKFFYIISCKQCAPNASQLLNYHHFPWKFKNYIHFCDARTGTFPTQAFFLITRLHPFRGCQFKGRGRKASVFNAKSFFSTWQFALICLIFSVYS